MIKHIVFFALSDQAEGKTKLENASFIKQELETLIKFIPEIQKIEVGINIPNAPKTDFDLALYTEFESFDSLNNYQIHPLHQKVAAYITKVKTNRAAVDYEI
jgi:phenylalanyl-tRNA synthetase alpha subunit